VRAVLLEHFGPPEALTMVELPDPAAGAGEALIDVAVANITFVETQLRAGNAPNPAMLPDLPAIPGNGVGGTVAAVGEGVDGRLVGRLVIATTGGSGAYAERVAVPVEALIEVPAALTIAEAVALLADGRTATALMRNAAVRPGETVLVEAAAGGVGSLLVQLALAAGARVVGAASGSKLELVRELGAEIAIDYGESDWPGRVRTAAGELDVVFDGVGGAIAREAFELVREGGRFHSFGLASGAFAAIDEQEAARRRVKIVRGVQLTADQMSELTRAALSAAVEGRLRPVIGQTYELQDAASAHAAIEARATRGKTLLIVGMSGGRQAR
jgi:NADPH2:quinone reductase